MKNLASTIVQNAKAHNGKNRFIYWDGTNDQDSIRAGFRAIVEARGFTFTGASFNGKGSVTIRGVGKPTYAYGLPCNAAVSSQVSIVLQEDRGIIREVYGRVLSELKSEELQSLKEVLHW